MREVMQQAGGRLSDGLTRSGAELAKLADGLLRRIGARSAAAPRSKLALPHPAAYAPAASATSHPREGAAETPPRAAQSGERSTAAARLQAPEGALEPQDAPSSRDAPCSQDASSSQDAPMPEAQGAAAASALRPAERAGGPFGLLTGGEASVRARLQRAARALASRAGGAETARGAARPSKASRRAKTTRFALRIAARDLSSPIASILLETAPTLARNGVRITLLLAEEPDEAAAASVARIGEALGEPPLEWWLRIADFEAWEDCREQALIGEELFWVGGRLGAVGPAGLAAGRLSTPGASLRAELDAARLRYAAAWRLGRAPSAALARRLSGA